MSRDEANTAEAESSDATTAAQVLRTAADKGQDQSESPNENSGLPGRGDDTNDHVGSAGRPDSSAYRPRDSSKAETAVVAQAPFTHRVMYDDPEEGLPEAIASPLGDEDFEERARAEADMQARRQMARLEEETKLLDSKKPTLISNPTWPTLPNETTKTYDVQAVQLVEEMIEDDEPLSQPASAVAPAVPTSAFDPPAHPEEPEVDDQPDIVEEPHMVPSHQTMFYSPTELYGYDRPIDLRSTRPMPESPWGAPKPTVKRVKKKTAKTAKVKSKGFAELIHEYRLPIITFAAGVVAGVFIAFLF